MRPHLSIEYRPVDSLTGYARNAREHSRAQVEQLAASINAFGFTNPILVGETYEIMAGHGRLEAAKLLGMTEVPVIVIGGLSDIQRRQLILADNRIALNAGWNAELLALELNDLEAAGADIQVLGFSDAELAKAFGQGGRTDPDAVPAVESVATSKRGDLWLCGRHRLLCGDSTNEADVGRLLSGVKPHLMVTDPPYGVKYDPTWRHRAGVNTSARTGKVENDDQADWTGAWKLFPGDVAYVWHGALHAAAVADSLVAAGFSMRAQIIWAKERLVIGRGDYHWQHEPCWYAVRKKGHWAGDRKQVTLWTIATGGQDAETAHGTQKPVECMRRPIVNNSSVGQAVYEPFCGSGTTMIAAEMETRDAYCMELSPVYVDVIVKRWQAYTGGEATLEGDGRAYAAIAQERGEAANVA